MHAQLGGEAIIIMEVNLFNIIHMCSNNWSREMPLVETMLQGNIYIYMYINI